MTERNEEREDDALRLDKWLWVARFFKSRSLAAGAVKGGRVEVNGVRPKPSRALHIGDELRIRRGPFEHLVRVRGIAKFRGPPARAAALYEESPESIARREAIAASLKMQAAAQPRFPGRPGKRDRRQILRFTRRHET